MVVHEVIEAPLEIANIDLPMSEQKSLVKVKNNASELINTEEKLSISCDHEENWPQVSESRSNKKKRVSKEKRKQSDHKTTSSDENNDCIQNDGTVIDENDLSELTTVYMKCKEVMKKIETKYGYLLHVDSDSNRKGKKRKAISEEEQTDTECNCTLNKKIVFDDDGKQSTVDLDADKHICPKKLKKIHIQPSIETKNIEIEYNENEIKLPNDLRELGSILKDTGIEQTYRNRVIEKIRALRLEYMNEIRFNKHSLVEKLKSNPDEVLDFCGTNLASLLGYS